MICLLFIVALIFLLLVVAVVRPLYPPGRIVHLIKCHHKGCCCCWCVRREYKPFWAKRSNFEVVLLYTAQVIFLLCEGVTAQACTCAEYPPFPFNSTLLFPDEWFWTTSQGMWQSICIRWSRSSIKIIQPALKPPRLCMYMKSRDKIPAMGGSLWRILILVMFSNYLKRRLIENNRCAIVFGSSSSALSIN